MLNLMRYFDRLQPVPGTEAFKWTPAQSNAHYESVTMRILTRLGGYGLVGGATAGVHGSDGRLHTNQLAFGAEVDDWSRVLVVRHPNRRAFFNCCVIPPPFPMRGRHRAGEANLGR